MEIWKAPKRTIAKKKSSHKRVSKRSEHKFFDVFFEMFLNGNHIRFSDVSSTSWAKLCSSGGKAGCSWCISMASKREENLRQKFLPCRFCWKFIFSEVERTIQPKMELNSAKLLRNKLNCSCFWEIFHHLLLAVLYLNSISCITHIHTSNFSKNFLCINIECASSHLIKSMQCTLPKTNICSCRQETPKRIRASQPPVFQGPWRWEAKAPNSRPD